MGLVHKDRYLTVVVISEIVEAASASEARKRVLDVDGRLGDFKEVTVSVVPLPPSEYKTVGAFKLLPA